MVFTFTIMFWFVRNIYYFFIMWYKQDIKRNCLIISFKPFPFFYSSRKLYTFPIIKTNMGFNICYSFRMFSMSWWWNETVIEYWKHLLSLRFFGFIVTLLFSNYSRDFMYDFPLFRTQNYFHFSIWSLLFGNYLRKR